MIRPDYEQSIVNLMASISIGLGGGETGYRPLDLLPPDELVGRPVILIVADGLGQRLLAEHPQSHLARHRRMQLTSVFPSTTAAAITSFATATAPQQHAITGWFTWFRELGSVAAVLPFVPRHGGASYSRSGVAPQALIGAPPLMNRLGPPCHHLAPLHIIDSDYSRASAGGARRHGHRNLAEFFDQIAALVHDDAPRYLFAYWTELDHLAHEFGAASAEVEEHFGAFDRAFAALLERIAGCGALVLVTADHGLIDTAPDRLIQIEDHPPLKAALQLPLCGEPRAAFCYVRAGQRRAFESYVRSELAEEVELVASEELLAEGYFGRRQPEPRLADRIGDYVLLPRGNRVIKDRLINEKPFSLIGVHGGLSADEMEVPLVVAEP